jgi:hypothetical protein
MSPEQIESLTAAVRSVDYLRRIVDEIERLHRIVFHDEECVDRNLMRGSAEQILVAEIAARHGGRPEGVLHTLHELERTGLRWPAAIAQLAVGIHSYFTTPLGIVMRQDIFGERAVFFAADAYDWIALQARSQGQRKAASTS